LSSLNRATEIFAPLDRERPLRAQVEAAVRVCPKHALSIEEN